MPKATLRDRFRYWFDTWMSKGTPAIVLLLFIASAVVVIVLGIVSWLVLKAFPDGKNEAGEAPWDIVWGALMRTLDPGTMGGDEGWLFRILMLLVTLVGLILVASLIGIVSGAFDSKIAQLRKGRSRVLEHGHTIVLGWNSKILTIARELAIANASERRSAIVVLAPRDVVEMEDRIHEDVHRLGRMRVICRTGDPRRLADLDLVSPQTAKSIILLAPEGADDPDGDVIKAALALTNDPRRGASRYHIVAELRDEANLDVARLASKGEAHWILGADLIGRIAVQSSRQSGLSVVYQELLDFAGDEIYFADPTGLVGGTYFDAQLAFPRSAAIGLLQSDRVVLNPPPDAEIRSGDRVIVIAEDDSTIATGDAPQVDSQSLVDHVRDRVRPERTLVLGANANLPSLLRHLDDYVPDGSSVHVVSMSAVAPFRSLPHLDVTVEHGDPTRRDTIEALDLAAYDHIVVLAEEAERDPERADGRTLVTLLQLRDVADREGFDLSIVSEMLDDTNRELAEVTEADDFVVSDKLVALALAQVSESRELKDVFGELFSSAGAEIYLRPAGEYVVPGAEIDFTALLEAARRRGETAIGYRIAAGSRDASAAYGVHLNPRKTDRFALDARDRVIVLAED